MSPHPSPLGRRARPPTGVRRHRPQGRSRPGLRRGFTLAELLIAMVLAAIITLALSHATVQITSGASRVDKRSQTQTEAALAMLRLRTELEQATAITTLTATQVTFTHPDVTGNGTADTITYQWLGTAGNPLTRNVNSGGEETVLTECRSFALSWVAPPIQLVAGTRYPIKLEYYEKNNSASCVLMWSASGISKQVIPQACLCPASIDPTATTTGLTGQYYDNSDFTGHKFTQTDTTVNKNWGTGSPGGGMSSNTFSVRWTGHLKPSTTANYTFYVSSDDGVRLWVNGYLLIDNWTDHTAATECSSATTGVSRIDIQLAAGAEGNTVKLDGSVRLLNAPAKGS